MQDFEKSDIGAQSAWKGFSSQTLYIASRLMLDENDYEYYPEDIEDLVIKKDDIVLEAVQVKNISSDLTLSSLASTKTSKSGDGFFKRMCSLHTKYPSFNCITVVYFGALGAEFQQLKEKNTNAKNALVKKLINNHELSKEEATWLINSLSFDKVSNQILNKNIESEIKKYVPVMAAPELAVELLIQYISELSKRKGYTTLKIWQEKIHEIGKSIAAIDGFYKEYNKSLVLLKELNCNDSGEKLMQEFSQGVSTEPSHIRCNLDFKRNYWLSEIKKTIDENGVAIIKGISGQGKSALSYRYLIDNYPEGRVFCIRSIVNEKQAENLVVALDSLGKYNSEIIIYIDVKPGETLWAFLLQELQSRGLSIPVLVSIRDEDYNLTPINGKTIKYGLLELYLSEDEAREIYDSVTIESPHSEFRTFEEAWTYFGGQGPLIEFMYLLTNKITLTQRLQEQIDSLLLDGVCDEWLELLQMVCYAGRLNCPVIFEAIKKQISCPTMQAAIRRFKDEYLIRIVDGNRIEALHPVRAQIISEILCNELGIDAKDIVFKILTCIPSQNIQIILLDLFSNHKYTIQDVYKLSTILFTDWVGYANVIKSLLWLDVKQYVDNNMPVLNSLVEERGKGWICFLPLDPSGILRPNEIIADKLKNLPTVNKEEMQKAIEKIKDSLSSLSIDYQFINIFINNSKVPIYLPSTDDGRTAFGYSLFWLSMRGRFITLSYTEDEIVKSVCDGNLQSSADAVRGLYEHHELSKSYNAAVKSIIKRLISEMKVLYFAETDDKIVCKFVPPLSSEVSLPDSVKSENHYWRIKMLEILQQIYPDKEYIDIELIGVDYLVDLGIETMDHKLHIHKSNRTNYWISELNSWVKNRIEYSVRPKTWNQYVCKIDSLRKTVQILIDDTNKLIDDVYGKGRFTKGRWKCVESGIEKFKKQTFSDSLLPKSVVDPYCLYSEGSQKNFNEKSEQYYTMHQVISVGQYEKFRKLFVDVYTSLDNFYNQFASVLLARINNLGMDTVDNPQLAMFNLYSAAKNIGEFQNEYKRLFTKYSLIDEKFECVEQESLLTLINVWRHVLDNPIRRLPIVYGAKQRYRKGSTYFMDMLSIAVKNLDAEVVYGDKYIYILVDIDVYGDYTLDEIYKNTFLEIRKVFHKCIFESSDRWYSETQNYELAFLPLLNGEYSSIAFSIPFYKLFNANESSITDIMIPCEIEPIVEEKMKLNVIQKQWVDGIRILSDIKLNLQRYQQVLEIPISENCLSGLNSYIDSLKTEINNLWEQFSILNSVFDTLINGADEENLELLNSIKPIFDCYEDIEKIILTQGDVCELIKTIESVLEIMFILQIYIGKLKF